MAETERGDSGTPAVYVPKTLIGKTAAWVLLHPRSSMVLFGVVTLLSILLSTRLTVDPNMLSLLPQDHPTTQAIQKVNAEEGGTNFMTLAFSGEDPIKRDAALVRLAQEIEGIEGVDYALFDIPPDLAWRLGMLQLDVPALGALEARLQAAIALGPAAANPFVASRLLDLGPLTEKLADQNGGTAVFRSNDGLARILVRPTGSAYDARFAAPFVARLDKVVATFDEAEADVSLVWMGGAYRHAVEDIQVIRNDLSSTVMVSALAVLALVALAFREMRATLVVFIPLVFANIWTTGVATLAVGSLNTFTSFYPAILLGLGVDFSLHLYARYREECSVQNSVKEAIYAAWDHVGPPCVTAAVTSAGGFCALWVAGFGGFRQLGTLLGAGVLLCLVSVMTMLPLLIAFRDRKGIRELRRRKLRLGRRVADGLSWRLSRIAPVSLILVAGLSALAATRLDMVGFQYDLSALRKTGLGYEDFDDAQRAAAESAFAPILVSFDSMDALASAHQRLAGPIAEGHVHNVRGLMSVFSVLPVDQAERVAHLSTLASLARHENMQYLPVQVRENLAMLGKEDPKVLAISDLPRGLQHALGATAARPRMLLLPSGNQWDLRNNVELRQSVLAAVPEGEAAGEYLALAVLYELVADDVVRVAATALLVVFLLSWLDLRHLGRALWVVAALAAGMSWAGAGMVATGIELSVVNFVGIPILMGIGVDVIIHLMHRVDEEGPGGVRRALATTGWASALSSATTVLSFASLSVAEHQGVRSMGHLIVLGLSLVTLAGFVLVPLGWSSIWRMQGKVGMRPTTNDSAGSDV